MNTTHPVTTIDEKPKNSTRTRVDHVVGDDMALNEKVHHDSSQSCPRVDIRRYALQNGNDTDDKCARQLDPRALLLRGHTAGRDQGR